MSFVRPEALAVLRRYRETIVGSGLVALGLWWLTGAQGLLILPAVALSVAGAVLLWLGIQRARFRRDGQGPGIVQVTEAQISYFGPLTGGTVALSGLMRITLDGTQHPPHWHFGRADAPPLLIPVNADGAERLFDAFSALPGFRMDRALKALENPAARRVVIWQSNSSKIAQPRLH